MIRSLWKEIQEVDTGRKALRSFGLLVGGVLLGIAAVVLWKNDWMVSNSAAWLAGIGAVLLAAGLISPTILKFPYRVWMGLAVVLGYVMTRVILTVVFYVVITPTGLVLRLFGKDPLQRTWNPGASTYWLDKTYDDDSPERLERYY